VLIDVSFFAGEFDKRGEVELLLIMISPAGLDTRMGLGCFPVAEFPSFNQ